MKCLFEAVISDGMGDAFLSQILELITTSISSLLIDFYIGLGRHSMISESRTASPTQPSGFLAYMTDHFIFQIIIQDHSFFLPDIGNDYNAPLIDENAE